MCPSGRDSYRAPARGRDRISPGEEWAGRVHSRLSEECEEKDRGAKTKNRVEKTTEAREHEDCVDCPGKVQGRKSEALEDHVICKQ